MQNYNGISFKRFRFSKKEIEQYSLDCNNESLLCDKVSLRYLNGKYLLFLKSAKIRVLSCKQLVRSKEINEIYMFKQIKIYFKISQLCYEIH